MAKQKETVSLPVKAHIMGRDDGPAGAMAYAYDKSDRLLARVELDRSGEGVLELPLLSERYPVRVVVGPIIKGKALRSADIMRRGAASVRVAVSQEMATAEIAIGEAVVQGWVAPRCCINGTLLKKVDRAGVTMDLPVCDAEVEVYEVDPIYLIIPRIPDLVIEEIRRWWWLEERYLHLEKVRVEPIPRPDPPWAESVTPAPEPEPQPGPLPPVDPAVRPRALGAAASFAEPSSAAQMTSASRYGESVSMGMMLETASVQQVRNLLLMRPDWARLVICRFYPYGVTKQLLGTAHTDECGKFTFCFWRKLGETDTPDLYFVAKQQICGYTFTIMERTPVCCHTHWDIACGAVVTLYATHPCTRVCAPCQAVIAPDRWVLMRAVGNKPLGEIHGTSEALASTTTAANRGTTDDGRPFGGLLRFRIEFDHTLRTATNVRYYRMAWRKGTSGGWTEMDAECVRHYAVVSGGEIVDRPYVLGPQKVGTTERLFEIPPALPPEGQWSFPNLYEDLTNVKFSSATYAPGGASLSEIGAAGKYQFKVDLFDTAGNLVNVNALNIEYRVPGEETSTGDLETDDAATLGLVVDDDGDGAPSFIMTLDVDNNRCYASIDPPAIGATATSDLCGVLRYVSGTAATVTMPYIAAHPRGYATYHFRLYRAATQIATTSGPVGGGSHTETAAVGDLMTIPGPPVKTCDVAAFSENVHVDALATDGWGILQQYDANAVRAYALAPEPPSP